jgi:hypothetical protein
VINVIAESDEECFNILANYQAFDQEYNDRIMSSIVKAPRFELSNQDEESRLIDVFLT